MIHLALTIAAALFLIWVAFVLIPHLYTNFINAGADAYNREQQAKWERDNAEAIRMARFIAQRQREVLAENERRGQDYINRTRFNVK